MKISTQNRERLVVVDFPWLIGLITFGAAIALALHLFQAYDAMTRKDVFGLGFAIAFLVAAGGAMTNRIAFDFDLTLRQLRWSRVGLFGYKGGTVPFDQITGANLQTSTGKNGAPTYRIALRTLGEVLPLTVTYSGGQEKSYRTICDAINQALGKTIKTGAPNGDQEILDLVADGQLIEAIRRVRARDNCGLKEAKDIVDRMKR